MAISSVITGRKVVEHQPDRPIERNWRAEQQHEPKTLVAPERIHDNKQPGAGERDAPPDHRSIIERHLIGRGDPTEECD